MRNKYVGDATSPTLLTSGGLTALRGAQVLGNIRNLHNRSQYEGMAFSVSISVSSGGNSGNNGPTGGLVSF